MPAMEINVEEFDIMELSLFERADPNTCFSSMDLEVAIVTLGWFLKKQLTIFFPHM